VQHVYASSGTYTVTAIATDSNGSTGSGSTVIVIGNRATPTMTFTVAPTFGPVTTNFQFTVVVTVPAGSTATVDHYEWNFGDGSATRSTASSSTNHVYATTGTFTPTVTAVMSDGTRPSSSTEVRVTS
jgi:PKD repeat protein